MKTFAKVMTVIFKVLLIIVLIAMLGYLIMCIWNAEIENTFKLNIGNYGHNPYWRDDWENGEIDAIYARLNESNQAEVAYDIYLAACKKLMLTEAYGIRATASIDVTAANLSLSVMSNRTEQYLVAGTPTLNANQKVYSSYTNTIYIVDCSNPALGGLLKSAIQFADRGYSDGTDSYKQKGSLSVMEEGGEVIEWSDKYAPEEVTAARTYNDDDIRDKCNFIINSTTILPESVVITREFDEHQNMYLYRIKLSLDCSDNSEGSATYYEAKAIGDVLGKNMKSLIYSKMDVDMTLYSNGYLMTWDTVQEWTLTYKLGFLSMSGTALNSKYEMFSYDPRDCKVVDFTQK